MTLPYIANTAADRQAMLAAIGVASVEELFADIPAEFCIGELSLPPALSEPELVRELSALAGRNRPADGMPCFLGGGAYRHFIPSVVGEVIGRSEFATAYTPYQAEISQGTLQTIFEFQSMVCELTAMDVANAGMYDGASALAEACLMAAAISGRRRIALLSTLHPHHQAVVRTYAFGRGLAVDVMPPDGLALSEEHACLAVPQPNFFGYFLPDVEAVERAVHAAGALFIVSADPISLGLFQPPGEYGADVVVGEGQSLGSPLNFGGPYLGLFACRQQYLRQMPGRIVGRTSDAQGRTGYVLTIQTREQHIRRERATSNICTSQQLVALAATVYLAAMGKQGLRQVAELCYHKAHYAAQRIAQLPGYALAFDDLFFKEFVVRCPRPPSEVNRALLERGIGGGLDVSQYVEDGLLLCVTEMNTRQEIDRLVEALAEIGGGA
ncbi:MAG: aminomethyl-transferring glycine dehydrogenase subunit GcvPA [Dehalococcoidia bacterium]|nr:aminomethyl-transferring glycine dehydrogenase subunit GcvPA [Dehalococcoidia bacterium]